MENLSHGHVKNGRPFLIVRFVLNVENMPQNIASNTMINFA